MNTANLELCKELYEVSGWRGTEKRWQGSLQFPDNCVAVLLDNCDGDGIAPAYDLGYLLRKLQGQKRASVSRLLSRDMWVASCVGIRKNCEAGTPEDAACKLTIELFNQSILTKGDK